MRSFIIASVILSLITAAVIANSVYVVSKINQLTDICDEIRESSSADSVNELVTEWQSCRDIIALSVHRIEIERAQDAIFALYSFRESPDDFNYHLSVIRSALETISDNQKISLNGLF